MTDTPDKPKATTSGPLTKSRLVGFPPRKPTPSRADDELMVALAKRNEQIDRLLKDEFGSLAPPPPPDILDNQSVRSRRAEGRIRHAKIEARRKEYETLTHSDLQSLIEDANSKLLQKQLEHAANMEAWRNSYWPAWAAQDLWSEAEFAAMCCGLTPNEGRSDTLAVSVNGARETISRGVLAKQLDFVARTDADSGAKLYGTARHFVPAVAVEWAQPRFNAFPEGLLAAVRARGAKPATPSTLNPAQYPAELRAAIEAFNAVRHDAQAIAGKTPKAAISAWLETNKLELSGSARERIATVANWQPGGGAPKTPG